VYKKPPAICRCGVKFVPTDPAKFHPTEAEDQLLDDIFRENDKVLFYHVVNQTACPHDCEVDGICEHGYLSLGMRAGVTEWK
jgi:hypothetical protein